MQCNGFFTFKESVIVNNKCIDIREIHLHIQSTITITCIYLSMGKIQYPIANCMGNKYCVSGSASVSVCISNMNFQ